jgi:hypothetical protein
MELFMIRFIRTIMEVTLLLKSGLILLVCNSQNRLPNPPPLQNQKEIIHMVKLLKLPRTSLRAIGETKLLLFNGH